MLLLFGSDTGLIVNPIKADKTADFEALVSKLRVAMQQSSNPIRKQQVAGWKVLKATEAGPGGSVLYLFLLEPSVPNADYMMSRLLAELFPNDVAELWTKLRDTYAGQPNKLTLQTMPVVAATTTPAPGAPAAPPPPKKP